MTSFRNPVPEDRTIVNGVWSDLLDRWLDSFINDGDETGLQVALLVSIEKNMLKNNDLLAGILTELRISNKYNELGFDEIIEEESAHEDRRR